MFRVIATTLLILSLAANLFAADAPPSHQRALELFQKKDFQGAIAEYQRLIAVSPSDTRALYNAACAFALLGDKPKAIELLKKAIEAGWTDREHLERDTDFDGIREEAGYKEALALLQERLAKIAKEDEARLAKLKALDATFQKMLADAVIPPEFQKPKDGWAGKPKSGQYNERLEIFARVKIEAYEHPNAWVHLGVPADYTSEKAWPLALILHGGPNGSGDNLAGFARLLNRHGIISAFVQAVSPQFELNWNAPHEGMNFLVIIKQIARTYRIDPYRIYLLGHSMGGGGAYAQGATLCDVWAAVVPMAGWYWLSTTNPPPIEWRRWATNVPFYIMHGELDRNVPIRLGRLAVKDFEEMGHKNFVYREFKGGGHSVMLTGSEWKPMLDWLLQQRRSTPPDFAAAVKKLSERGQRSTWTPQGGAIGSYQRGPWLAPYKSNE
jgi:pimeloyl-ACP methyl ester carboxylesterase